MNNITKLSIKLFLALLLVIGGILLEIVWKVTDFLTFGGNIILK